MIWVLLLSGLNLLDGVITITMIDPAGELNPLLKGIWLHYGGMWTLFIKVTVVTGFALLLERCEKITELKILCLVYTVICLYHYINTGLTF